MLRKILILTAIVSVFSACFCTEAAQIDSTWVGGSQGEWGNASNWSPAIVPDNNETNSFIVTIDSNSIGVDEIEVGLQQSRDINSLDCYGAVRLESWMWYLPDLNIPSGLTNHGSLDLELDIRGDVTNAAGAELDMWEHLNIYGNLYNQAEATIWFSYRDIDIEGGGIIENDGRIVCHADGGPGEMPLFENRGSIQLLGGGCSAEDVFDNNGTGHIQGSGFIIGHQLIQNKGTICASMGTLLLHSEGTLINTGTLKNDVGATLHIANVIEPPITDINNNGTIEVNANGSVVFDCNLVNEPNGIIKLLGGTLAATMITQSADANFAGFGSITGNVVIEPNGLIELTGPTNIVGDVNIPAGATLKISDGQTLITGHTTCDGSINLIGGTVIFQGGCDCDDCDISHTPGLYRNHFDINADGIENFKDFSAFAKSWLWQATWY